MDLAMPDGREVQQILNNFQDISCNFNLLCCRIILEKAG
jgi:hypothetical protein